MLPDEFSRKIAIIYSRRNAVIWNDRDKKSSKIEEIMGVKFSTVRSWINGRGKPGKGSVNRTDFGERICDSLNNALKDKIKRKITTNDFFGKVNIYEFADIFYIDRNLCNLIIDEFLYDRYPLFLNYYLTNEGEANKFFDQYKGIYEIYRMGTSKSNSNSIFVSSLHVRYVIKCNDNFAVRCKLHIPNIQDSLVKYDGFLTMLNDRLYWVFEDRNNRDFIFIITNTGIHHRPSKFFAGLYMSLNQDQPPIPVSRAVCFKRIKESTNNEEMQDFMYNSPRIIVEDEFKNIENQIYEEIRWSEFKNEIKI